VAVLGIVAKLYSDSLKQLLATATVLPALIYLLTVATYAVRRKSLSTREGYFSLGRWGGWVSGAAIAWLILLIAILTIPREFHSATRVSAAVCIVGGIVYWTAIKRRITRGLAGVHAAEIKDIDN